MIHANSILVLLCLSAGLAGAHEGGEMEAQIGQGKAVEAYDVRRGIKLSEKAKSGIGISTIKITKPLLLKVPSSALIKTRGEHAVYLLSEGFFKFTPVVNLAVGDEVVVKGAPLLRVAELNVSAGGTEEHEEAEGQKSDHDNETHSEAKESDHD